MAQLTKRPAWRVALEAVPAWVGRMIPARRIRAAYPIGNVAAMVNLHSPEDTMRIAAVYRCVRLISETIAALPWKVFRETGTTFEAVANHPAQWILHTQASDEMSAFVFKRQIIANALLWGNGYAEIQRDTANRPYALLLLAPDRVEPGYDVNGKLVYQVRQSDGTFIYLPPSRVFHLQGIGSDGLRGYSVLEVAAKNLSVGVSLEDSLARFFANGFRPMGLLKTKGRMSGEAFEAFEKRLDQFSGLRNRWRALPLDQDMDWQALAVDAEEAQALEMRKFSVIDVCRWFGVPPHKVFDLERATFTNIESQGREFLQDCLTPWIVQLEQEANSKLLGRNFGGLYSKININAVIRADYATRTAGYQILRNSGVLSVNEIRALEDMPTISKADGGDLRVMQGQYVPLEKIGKEPPKPPAPPPGTTPPPPQEGDDTQQQPNAPERR